MLPHQSDSLPKSLSCSEALWILFFCLGLYFQQSCRPFLLICWGELSSFPKWAAFIILIPLPHLFCRALKTPRRQERSGNEIRGRKSRDGGRASERASVTSGSLLVQSSDITKWCLEKAANLAKEWQLCMECVSVCVCHLSECTDSPYDCVCQWWVFCMCWTELHLRLRLTLQSLHHVVRLFLFKKNLLMQKD